MFNRGNVVFDWFMSSDCGCGDCKRVREHAASLLPIKFLEAASNKPLRISGLVGSIVAAFLVGKKQ